jgi:hypothetical protein
MLVFIFDLEKSTPAGLGKIYTRIEENSFSHHHHRGGIWKSYREP